MAGKMDGIDKLKEQQVKVVYKDINSEGKEVRSIKIGKMVDSDQDFIYLISSNTYTAIPKSIIQRIEVAGSDKG